MGNKLIVLIVTLLLLTPLAFPIPVFAIDAPSLNSPSDSSTVSTSQLSWQTVTGATTYRVQVADNSSFSSPKKDTQTDNLTYKPVLDNGTYFWHVKAKDSSGTWGDWSSTWSFTLGPAPTTSPTATPNPTATPSADPSPTSTPIPTSVPTTTPTLSPTPTSSPASIGSPVDNFALSSIPSTIHYDQSFTINVQLQGLTPNSPYYLKGAFLEDGSSNYFGLTQVGSNWSNNSASYSSQYNFTTDNTGKWSGQLTLKPDPNDTGFTGAGDYQFKVARYSSTGSGPTWSAIYTINIDNAPSPSSSPTATPSPTVNPTTSTNTIPTATPAKTSSVSAALSTDVEHQIDLPNLDSSQTATVAGIQTAVFKDFNQSANNQYLWYIIGGVGLILLGASPTIYNFVKNGPNLRIPWNSIVHPLTNIKSKTINAIHHLQR